MCGDGNGSSGASLVRGLTDLFVAGERGCVKEGLHRGFSEAVAALMSSGLVVLIDPEIEIGLKLSDGVVDFFAESDAIELVEQGLVEALDNTIRLRAFRFGSCVIDVFHGQVELVFMPVVCAAM